MTPTDELEVDPEQPVADAPRTELGFARWLPIAVVAIGIATDLMLRSDLDTIAGTAFALAVAAALYATPAVRGSTPARIAIATGGLAALLLSLRTSQWLVPLNVAAVVGLLFVAAALPAVPSWRDLPVGGLIGRLLRAGSAFAASPSLLRRSTESSMPAVGRASTAPVGALARGALLALPVVALLCALLASADGVFASFITGSANPGPWFGHLVLVALGVWIGGAVLWFATDEWAPRPVTPPVRLGTTEAAVVLGGLVAVYALFVAAQVVAAGASAGYLVDTTGLTRAEYARTGFFQLLWAAGLTLVVLLGLHWAVGRDRATPTVVRALQVATVLLTVVVVVVAERRLDLYADAYGLTMLRLYCTIFGWWLAAVVAITGAYVSRRWHHRWLPTAIGVLALAALVGVNVVNPEQVVVDHNVQRAIDGADLDVDYLVLLSDDAVPALVDGVGRLPKDDAAELSAQLCARPVDVRPWYGSNRSSSRAADELADLCGG